MTQQRLVTIAAALALLTALAPASVLAARGNATRTTGPVISTEATSLGRILDVGGRTVYLFEKDKHGKSACTSACASFWPPLIATGKPLATGGAQASLIGTTKRPDGRLQVTYNNHPLYMFVKDAKRGQTRGEGVSAFGAEWYVLSPSGGKIEKGSHGGGY